MAKAQRESGHGRTGKPVAAAAASSPLETYRMRPLLVSAIQYTGPDGNLAEVAAFLAPEGGPFNPRGANAAHPISVCDWRGRVHHLEPGAWVVRTNLGLDVWCDGEFWSRCEPVGVVDALVDPIPALPTTGVMEPD